MRRTRPGRTIVPLAAGVAAAAAAVPAAGAPAGFGGNACRLLTAGQVASVHVRGGCKHSAARTTVGSGWTAVWGTRGKGSVVLSIVRVSNPAFIPLAERAQKGGKPVGVGSWSRSEGLANGRTAARIVFVVHSYLVNVDVGTPTAKPLKTAAPVIRLARVVAGRL